MCLYLHGWIYVSEKAEPLWRLFLMFGYPWKGIVGLSSYMEIKVRINQQSLSCSL